MVAPPQAPADRRQLAGAGMCAASAASFGAMAIFGKLAYDAGVGVLTLLFVRFVIAAGVFGTINATRRRPFPRRRVLLSRGSSAPARRRRSRSRRRCPAR